MSVYSRYKRRADGFRALVELLETTPVARRQRMIDIGQAEDAEYTEEALKYLLHFEDVLALPDLELAEVVAEASPKMLAFAICKAGAEVRERFLRNAKPRRAAELRDLLEETGELGAAERGGAQLKVIEATRALERRGLIRTKRIPNR